MIEGKYINAAGPEWVISRREHAPRLTAALPPTPDVNRCKTDIGNSTSALGCKLVVIRGTR
jgi:hypothetical protein